MRLILAFTLLLAVALVPAAASAGSHHVDYYYPPHPEPEVFVARADVLPNMERGVRVGFITGITKNQLEKPILPAVVMFAKGWEADKLIVVSLQDGYVDTLFRARAYFAMLTASARTLPIFEEMGVQEDFTFFDLARMLGFKQITWSNGVDESYQWKLESPAE